MGGAASSQLMMRAPWPPIRSRRSRVAPSAAAWARCRLSALDFFANEGVAEVFWPALADGLRFRAFGEHEEGHVPPSGRTLVEDLAVGRLVRLLSGCWKFKVERLKFTDGCAVRPFC